MTRITATKAQRTINKVDGGGYKPTQAREMQTFTYSNGKKITVPVAKGQIINPEKLYKKHFPSQWE